MKVIRGDNPTKCNQCPRVVSCPLLYDKRLHGYAGIRILKTCSEGKSDRNASALETQKGGHTCDKLGRCLACGKDGTGSNKKRVHMMIFCEKCEVGAHFKCVKLLDTLESWRRKGHAEHSCATNAMLSKVRHPV